MMRRLLWVVLLVTLAGCSTEHHTSAPTELPVETATPQSTATPLIATESSPTIEAPVESTSLPPTETTATTPVDGHILFLADTESNQRVLWSVKPDGSDLRQLTTMETSNFAVLPNADTPLVAYVGADQILTLHLLNLNTMEDIELTQLTSPQTDYANPRGVSIDIGIRSSRSLQWSPDGKWLAFVGAMDGTSSDVYSYELATAQIRWLTSGEDHILQMLWSPDSQWILHSSVDSFERSGSAFMSAKGVWLARPDGGSIIKLDEARPTYFDRWLDPETILTYGLDGMGASRDLRTINIRTGEIIEYEPPCFDNPIFAPEINTYLVNVYTQVCGSDGWDDGLYLVTPTGISNLGDDFWLNDGYWSTEMQMFLGYGPDDSLSGILPNGLIVRNLEMVAPPRGAKIFNDGNLWVWAEDGDVYAAHAPDYLPMAVDGELDVMDWGPIAYIP